MIRIVSGEFRGRRLAVAPDVRPTTERAREALFSILGEGVRGAKVLDAAAGSGALGFEALSRGAREIVFVEANRRTDGPRSGSHANGGELPSARPPGRFRPRLLRPALVRSGRRRTGRPLEGTRSRRDVHRGAGKCGEPMARRSRRADRPALRDDRAPHLPE